MAVHATPTTKEAVVVHATLTTARMLKMIAAASLATLAFAVPEARDAPIVTYVPALGIVGEGEGGARS
eukprot:COSAG02_NODE_2321_length_9138_cov_11.428366_2_plen_68_part_00